MHVVVDVPEPKLSLDRALTQQFSDIQRQLLGLVKSQQSAQVAAREDLLQAMRQQQTSLVSAFERLLGVVSKTVATQPTDGLADALRGLKTAVADLPGELRQSLETQYRSFQSQVMRPTVTPKVTVQMPSGLTDRLDALQEAVVHGLRRSRNRTFGSNY